MALGKGLGALISSSNSGKKDKTQDKSERLWLIPLASIQPNPDQPRKHFKPLELEQLADSIKEHGVLQPVLVSERTDGGYELISGERRWRASKIAGLAEIPCVVKKMANQQKLEVALIENVQREDLTALEEAFAYKRLSEEFGLSNKEIAKKVGKADSTISNVMRLLGLPDEIKEALNTGKISPTQARALLSLRNKSDQLDMMASMMGKKITVQELERAVSRKSAGQKSGVRRRDPNIVYLEDQLRTHLDTKVTITEQGNKGRVIIDYYSREELTDLVDKLTA